MIDAASVLQYRPLLDALESFRRDMRTIEAADRRREGQKPIARCEHLLERLEAQGAAIV